MNKLHFIKILATMILAAMATMGAHAQADESRSWIYASGSTNSQDSVSSVIGTGNYSMGRNSFVGGLNSYASGAQSFAFGTSDTVTGANAIAFGWKSRAEGPYSFAQGYGNTTWGDGSVTMGIMNQAYGWAGMALGYNNCAHGVATVSLGSNLFTTRDYGITIGSGINGQHRMENTAGIIMMGVNAMYPTLAITESPNDGKIHFEKTGKVAIGSVVPQSKLHIQSDSGEDAGITLESGNKNTDSAYVRFQYADRYISVGTDNRMRVSAGNNDLHLIADRYCLNSDATYLANEGDRVLLIRSPRALFLRSNNVTLLGKVGINTENNTSAYALAVDGGIITTKVYIQDVEDWPDHVFDGAYRLMPLHELKKYIGDNKHLPDIPSESEIVRQGYDLHEMQSAMMKKIEELTLYTLQQQEEIEALRKMVDELKGK